MIIRNPRFSRTRMNESAAKAKTGHADYGRLSYDWDIMYDDFEMTDDLNDKIQKLLFKDPSFPNVSKLEELLSDTFTFDTKMEINSCSVRSKKAFTLTFVGIYDIFEITVNF